MQRALSRIWADIRARRNIDNYVVTVFAFVFALLSLFGDIVPDQLKMTVILAALGLLVYNLTVPDKSGSMSADDLLNDRSNFTPFTERLKGAHKVWIYAPSAVNVLSVENLTAIKDKILTHASGELRVVIQDPEEKEALRIGIRQLDESLDQPMQDLEESIYQTLKRLAKVPGWGLPGYCAYRFLPYNPGFSLIVIDPDKRSGTVIVEFHAYHHRHMPDRMHIELTPQLSERWFKYWVEQFEYIWDEARQPDQPAS